MTIKRTRLLITLSVLILLISGTVLAIQIAKGYRPNLKKMSLNGMGLLSTSSYPKSAQVFVNDRLTTVRLAQQKLREQVNGIAKRRPPIVVA